MSRTDDDEQWIVEALASLDRPAMPQEVARRLDEALATPSPAAVVPRQSTGPQHHGVRRRSWLIGVAGVAAAAAGVALVNPFQPGFFGTPEPGVQMAVPSPGSSVAAPSGNAAPATPIPAATEAAVSRVLIASQTVYTTGTLSDQVVEVARTARSGRSPSATLDELWAGSPAATTRGAAVCVAALPAPSEDLLFIDRAVFEGQPALVVARRAPAAIDVYVLGAGCTAEDVNVLMRVTVEAPSPPWE